MRVHDYSKRRNLKIILNIMGTWVKNSLMKLNLNGFGAIGKKMEYYQ